MALPTGPIPRVAVDEIIEEAWGDSVAQSLNNLKEGTTWATWSPAAGVEYDAETAGVMTTWFTFGAGDIEFQIPDWATQAFVLYSISGVAYGPVVSGPAEPGHRITYLLRAEFGTIQGRQVRFTGQGGWFGLTWADQFLDIEDIDTGDRVIRIKAQRIEGSTTDTWTLFDQSDMAVQILYYGNAIDWYPGL